MSVSLVMTKPGCADAARIVPVATEQAFAGDWLPACSALQLQWVPLFRTGLPIQPQEILPIVDELTQLRAFLTTQGADETMAQRVAHQRARLDGLIDALVQARTDPTWELYIG